MTVSHTGKISISWLLVILDPKENVPYANVPEQSHCHSQEV
jgi:hypothetical protein